MLLLTMAENIFLVERKESKCESSVVDLMCSEKLERIQALKDVQFTFLGQLAKCVLILQKQQNIFHMDLIPRGNN